MREVYLDFAATTPTDKGVVDVMQPFFSDVFANPSSLHGPGRKAKEAVEQARADIAKQIGVHADEIVFTSGATEAANLAVLGAARAFGGRGRHIVVSSIEHHAVLEAALALEKEGFEVTQVKPATDGIVSVDAVLEAIRPDTVLVSLMLANNEIGTLQPVAELGNAIEKLRAKTGAPFPLLHSDAAQAPAYLAIDVAKLHVDLLDFSGSKLYGPKGVGALFVQRDVQLKPLMYGGGQEMGVRPGTPFVAGIVGLQKAFEIAAGRREDDAGRQVALRDKLISGIQTQFDDTHLNGHATKRLPNNVNISFLGLEAETLLIYLDAQGIYAATGSACTSAALKKSHVVSSLGGPKDAANGAMRFTLGRSTTETDIDYLLEVLPGVVEKLQSF